jgi:hypothetical protein
MKSSPRASRCINKGVVLPVIGAAPALAKDTTGIELAGKAEKATTAKSKALISIAQNKAVCEYEVKMPLQEGKQGDTPLPQKGKPIYEPPPEALL